MPLFPKRIVDHLGLLGRGATAPQLVRAEDQLIYVAKDDVQGVPSVRASEYLWLSIAGLIGLPALQPILLEDLSGRWLVGTRRDVSALADAAGRTEMLAGRIISGGTQLSRILAFDLFAANWDRHPANYLVVDDGSGQLAILAIDFSHVTRHPGVAQIDPLVQNCATRDAIGPLLSPYGADLCAALQVIDRLEMIAVSEVNSILNEIPPDWLHNSDKADVLAWWNGTGRPDRCLAIRQGFQNGTYF